MPGLAKPILPGFCTVDFGAAPSKFQLKASGPLPMEPVAEAANSTVPPALMTTLLGGEVMSALGLRLAMLVASSSLIMSEARSGAVSCGEQSAAWFSQSGLAAGSCSAQPPSRYASSNNPVKGRIENSRERGARTR